MSLSVINNYVNASNNKIDTLQVSKSTIGGWAPVFFNNYDPKEIDLINKQILDKKIKKIKISYSNNMHKLAFKIKNNLHYNYITVDMNLLELKDIDGTSYNHNQVVVTLYFQ